MKLNKLRTRFSYHKKKKKTSRRWEKEWGRERRKMQETQVSLFLYNFFPLLLFRGGEENVCWRLASEKRKKQQKKKKKSKNMNENKLKSCRKILTCRSRYSEFLSSRLCCSFFIRLPFNSFKRILNHFPSHERQQNETTASALFLIFFFFIRECFLNETIEYLWAFLFDFMTANNQFFFCPHYSPHVQNNWLLANFSCHQQN